MPEFRFQHCLGRGGFGEVYRAVMSRGGGLEVDVAVKVLRGDLEPSSQGVQRLRDEGRLLGRLTHPTILRVYDLVVIGGHAALVSEYVDGDDLSRLLRQEALPARAVYEAIAQVAAALDAAWSWPSVTDRSKPLHLVHRDIKPDNIRIEPSGVVKLLDFGIAQASTVRREAHTSVNTIMGSTQYLSPERLVQQEVGPESDVFALGCTLFEALTSEALFVRKSMRQMYLLMIDEQRFDAFVAERTRTFFDRIGGDRGVALLSSMTAWRKERRPTAAEVAARCDLISDTTSGPSLTAWARGRRWEEPPEFSGSLEGQVFQTSNASLSVGDPAPATEPVLAPPPLVTAFLGPSPATAAAWSDDPRQAQLDEPTQRLEPPQAAELGVTPPQVSRWDNEDTTDGQPSRTRPAPPPSSSPWSEAERSALAAAEPLPSSLPTVQLAPPPSPPGPPRAPELDEETPPMARRRSLLRPVGRERVSVDLVDPTPKTGPLPPEPSTDQGSDGSLSTARLPVLHRQRWGDGAPTAADLGVVELDTGPILHRGVLKLPPMLDDAPDQERTVKLQRRPRLGTDGVPIPRRRVSAEPATGPRFGRQVTGELDLLRTPDLADRSEATEPSLEASELGTMGETTQRVPALSEDTWTGALESARTPASAPPREAPRDEAEEAVTQDSPPRAHHDSIDELPEPSSPPREPSTPLPSRAAEPARSPPGPREVTESLGPVPPLVPADSPASRARRGGDEEVSGVRRGRVRGNESNPLLAASAGLLALVLGVGVLLVILVLAWVFGG